MESLIILSVNNLESRCDMILNVTEEQKKLIESQGYMVVEFKAWFRKLGDYMTEYVRGFNDMSEVILLFLEEKAHNAFDVEFFMECGRKLV